MPDSVQEGYSNTIWGHKKEVTPYKLDYILSRTNKA